MRDDIESLRKWGDWGDDDELYNVLHVERRRALAHQQVLEEWLTRHTEVHAAWRGMDPAAELSTSFGPYLVGMQCWHIASEYATHSDDMGVPVPEADRAERLAWRFAFSRYAVEEREVPVVLEPRDDGSGIVVRDGDGATAVALSAEQFVAAVSLRLPPGSAGADPGAADLIRKLKVLL